MYLTITSTASDGASDLGYLLHKHPERAQSFELVGRARARVLPRGDRRTVHGRSAARGRPDRAGPAWPPRQATPSALGQYVNDRPYAASSMLAVALGKVFRTAMAGRCDARPDLVEPAAAARHPSPGAAEPRRRRAGRELFEPLGWAVEATAGPARRRRFPPGATPATSTCGCAATMRAARRAVAPLRAAAGARRRQALLGRRPTRSTSCSAPAATGSPTTRSAS